MFGWVWVAWLGLASETRTTGCVCYYFVGGATGTCMAYGELESFVNATIIVNHHIKP